MDISKASNYERLAFDVLGRDAKKTTGYMQEFSKKGKVSLADYGASANAFKKLGFESDSSTHQKRLEMIRRIYKTSGLVIDPHTADGVYVGRRHKDKKVPMLCMATARPVKFEDTIRESFGTVPKRPKRFSNIESAISSDSFTVMDADAQALKSFIRKHSA
jgi:threonine synthase